MSRRILLHSFFISIGSFSKLHARHVGSGVTKCHPTTFFAPRSRSFCTMSARSLGGPFHASTMSVFLFASADRRCIATSLHTASRAAVCPPVYESSQTVPNMPMRILSRLTIDTFECSDATFSQNVDLPAYWGPTVRTTCFTRVSFVLPAPHYCSRTKCKGRMLFCSLFGALHRQRYDLLELFDVDVGELFYVQASASFFVLAKLEQKVVLAFLGSEPAIGHGKALESV